MSDNPKSDKDRYRVEITYDGSSGLAKHTFFYDIYSQAEAEAEEFCLDGFRFEGPKEVGRVPLRYFTIVPASRIIRIEVLPPQQQLADQNEADLHARIEKMNSENPGKDFFKWPFSGTEEGDNRFHRTFTTHSREESE